MSSEPAVIVPAVIGCFVAVIFLCCIYAICKKNCGGGQSTSQGHRHKTHFSSSNYGDSHMIGMHDTGFDHHHHTTSDDHCSSGGWDGGGGGGSCDTGGGGGGGGCDSGGGGGGGDGGGGGGCD